METFRIAHISDLHFAKNAPRGESLAIKLANDPRGISTSHFGNIWQPASHCPHVAQRLAMFFKENIEHFDLILATGDLATTGNNDDLMSALSFFSSQAINDGWLSSEEKATIGFIDRAKIALLPGNHDRYGRAPFFWPDNANFDNFFSDYWPLRSRTAYWGARSQQTGDALAVIMADFSFTDERASKLSPMEYLGKGFVDDRIIKDLVRRTKEVRDISEPKVAVIWAVHFPPLEFEHVDMLLELIDRSVLIDAAIDNDVNHIFCGHTHGYPVDGEFVVGSKLKIFVTGTATEFMIGNNFNNSFHVAELEVDSGRVLKCQYSKYVYGKKTGGEFIRI